MLYNEHNYINVFLTFLVSVPVSAQPFVYVSDKHYQNQVEGGCSGRVITNQIENFNNLRRVKTKFRNDFTLTFPKSTFHPSVFTIIDMYFSKKPQTPSTITNDQRNKFSQSNTMYYLDNDKVYSLLNKFALLIDGLKGYYVKQNIILV